MNEHRKKKLKPLLGAVPEGFLVDARWLTARGIARASIHDYAASGWLAPVTRGVYRRPVAGEGAPPDRCDWRLVVLSLQNLLNADLHVGGATALRLYGHEHYLSLGRVPDVYLYGEDAPGWLARIEADAGFVVRRRTLFAKNRLGIERQALNLSTQTLSGTNNEKGKPNNPWTWPLLLSSVERATLELMNELPAHETFHKVDMIFEGLTELRPKSLMALLAVCRSVKTKRLFFLFADRHRHGWLKHLDKSAVNLGSGDRQLVEGGRLHPVYKVTVPAEFAGAEGEDRDGS
jgi:hypothetical protein